jgi:general secretion pathway protein J
MKKGFTLIELLISVTILAILLAVVFGSLRIGARAWEKGEGDIEKHQRLRMVTEILYREISCAFPYETTESELDTHRKFYVFEGESTSIKFVTTMPLKRKLGLSLLEIWVDEDRGLLIREKDALKTNILKEESGEESEENVLDAQVAHMEFKYYDLGEGEEEGEWVESWNAKEKGRMPRAVKVELAFKGDEENTKELVIPLMALGKDLRTKEGTSGGQISCVRCKKSKDVV